MDEQERQAEIDFLEEKWASPAYGECNCEPVPPSVEKIRRQEITTTLGILAVAGGLITIMYAFEGQLARDVIPEAPVQPIIRPAVTPNTVTPEIQPTTSPDYGPSSTRLYPWYGSYPRSGQPQETTTETNE